ncbi:MAG: A/G-specific adenine glycosylase [Pirellulales bacterium]|nr:A/G-specific adenine glycosylase [Pirellulales bacterium]
MPRAKRATPAIPDPASHAWKRQLRRRLLAWFERHARDLPWRRTRDPYRVWVSEIMLQQTQVATVANYFPRFIEAFPTIASLAAAPESQVLRLWEGLGYYRRARQLHRAAGVVLTEHGGRFPQDAEVVRRLPGIGRYTAGAILSIAFDARQPILEANTLRVASRLLGYRGDPRGTAGQKVLWQAAEDWLPDQRTGAFNQAFMELGSLVCKIRAPQCDACPVAALCVARQAGLVAEIPPPATRPEVEEVTEAAIVVRRGGRVLLCRRDASGRWAGMWDFPRVALQKKTAADRVCEITAYLRRATGLEVALGTTLATLRHGVTRYRITLECLTAEALSGRARPGPGCDKLAWVYPSQLGEYPLHVTGRKLARLLARTSD